MYQSFLSNIGHLLWPYVRCNFYYYHPRNWHSRFVLLLLLLLSILVITYRNRLSSTAHNLNNRLRSSNLHPPLYPPAAPLLNLPSFKYLINPVICREDGYNSSNSTTRDGDKKSTVLAIVLIHSHPSNVDVRNTARHHMSQELLTSLGIKRVFLLGQALIDQTNYPAVHQSVVTEESNKYMDIVQGNFIEHYRNLTYKHVMGLTWATHYCSQAKFVIKMDDDIAVDLFQIRQMILNKYRDLNNELLGLVQIESHPLRTNASKWRVTKEEFGGTVYPAFLSGWCYIAPMATVNKLAKKANTLPYFWIDDVYVTGILAEKLAITREGINNQFTIHRAHLKCCLDPGHFESLRYTCDYIAAPTGGETHLLAAALDQFRHCYRRGCDVRQGKQVLAKTCIVTPRDDLVGKGVGEVIALS